MPRNRTEGDIPLTAIATGNVDKLQCLLRKIGIDDAEFTNPDGMGRIRFYNSNGSKIDANTPLADVLKGTTAGVKGASYRSRCSWNTRKRWTM